LAPSATAEHISAGPISETTNAAEVKQPPEEAALSDAAKSIERLTEAIEAISKKAITAVKEYNLTMTQMLANIDGHAEAVYTALVDPDWSADLARKRLHESDDSLGEGSRKRARQED
jgi:Na+/phosphate symporter